MDSINSHRSPETKTKPKATQTPPPGGKSGERQPSRLGAPTVEPQQLPCPRCQSTNTKFCYYNNYNLSQPRHFCKACRRYWTRGGTLRNVPVGGGTRKSSSSSNKRSRDDDDDGHGEGGDVTMIKAQAPEPAVTDPNPVPDYEAAGSTKLNDAVPSVEKQGNLSLSSWWNSAGLGPLDGYGLGFGSDPGPGIGYENGSLNWPIEQVNIGVEGGGALVSGESTGDSNWQVGGGGECEYFSWPELAIATPADAEK